MLNIYIARHGQDLDNRNGILNGQRDNILTDLGIKQAHELAQGLLDLQIQFTRVYSSPLIRAVQTARIVCDKLNLLSPYQLASLIERDFGIMTGLKIDEIEHVCAPDIIKTETITYFLNPEGAETFPELYERARKALGVLTFVHNNCNILLVTHGDIGKMLYAAYYELPWKQVLTEFHFGNGELIRLSKESESASRHIIRIEQHNL
jgi:broad specificity phosphatase PhoE